MRDTKKLMVRLTEYTSKIMLEEFGIKVEVRFIRTRPGQADHNLHAWCCPEEKYISYNKTHLANLSMNWWWDVMIHEAAHFDKQTSTKRKLRKKLREWLDEYHTLAFWKANERLQKKYNKYNKSFEEVKTE